MQIEDRIGNQLLWSMKCHIPTAVALEHLNSALGKLFRGNQDVPCFSIPPQRNYWRVLEQQQHVTDAALLAELHQPFLQAEAGRIIDRAELKGRNQGHPNRI